MIIDKHQVLGYLGIDNDTGGKFYQKYWEIII